MTQFFIHHHDPQFEEPPWPGVRRLGPYNTLEEAQAQAEADAASGYGVALGIFSEEESENLKEKQADEQESGDPEVSSETILEEGNKIRETQVQERLSLMAEDRASLSSILPEGITVDDIDEAKAGGK